MWLDCLPCSAISFVGLLNGLCWPVIPVDRILIYRYWIWVRQAHPSYRLQNNENNVHLQQNMYILLLQKKLNVKLTACLGQFQGWLRDITTCNYKHRNIKILFSVSHLYLLVYRTSSIKPPYLKSPSPYFLGWKLLSPSPPSLLSPPSHLLFLHNQINKGHLIIDNYRKHKHSMSLN